MQPQKQHFAPLNPVSLYAATAQEGRATARGAVGRVTTADTGRQSALAARLLTPQSHPKET
jgi:hypothetical protein